MGLGQVAWHTTVNKFRYLFFHLRPIVARCYTSYRLLFARVRQIMHHSHYGGTVGYWYNWARLFIIRYIAKQINSGAKLYVAQIQRFHMVALPMFLHFLTCALVSRQQLMVNGLKSNRNCSYRYVILGYVTFRKPPPSTSSFYQHMRPPPVLKEIAHLSGRLPIEIF